MVQNQDRNAQAGENSPTNMYIWRLSRAEAEKKQGMVNRDLMRRRFISH